MLRYWVDVVLLWDMQMVIHNHPDILNYQPLIFQCFTVYAALTGKMQVLPKTLTRQKRLCSLKGATDPEWR